MYSLSLMVKINEYILLSTIFCILLLSLCPTIYVGDSSLFAAASFSLGSAHPPGYPLYIILGKLLTFIPFGNVAFKVNLVNAIFGTLTCLMVFKVSMELTEDKYASWASALICGISPIFFMASLNAKGVYTLNSFLSMSVFYLGIRILNGGDFVKNSLLGFFIIGLGMGNHQTIGFIGLIFLLPLSVKWKDIKVKWIFWGILSFFIGFSVNLFLYFRSTAVEHHGGLILYSYAGTWEQFVKVLLRENYKGASTPNAVSSVLYIGKAWFYGLKNSLSYIAFYSIKPVLLFLFLGFIGLRKKKTILSYFIFSLLVWFALLGRMVCCSPELKTEDIQTISVYFLPVIPILYSIVSVGFTTIIDFVKRKTWKIMPRFIPYVIAILPFIFLPYSIKAFSLDRNFIAYDYGRDMANSLPLKSLLMNYTDNAMFTTFYMRTVERLREDVLVMNTAGKEDIYGVESSPPWKYSELYPDFYKRRKSKIGEINRDFALKDKLFANTPLELTQIISKSYSYYPYVFSVALWPETMPVEGFKKEIRNRFKSGYEKINYERVLELPFSYDFLVREILTAYGFNTMVYADLIKRGGEEKIGNEFYRKAFLIGPPEGFLWPYINFLLQDGREKEAFAFINGLKKAGGLYGEFAGILEQKAISTIEIEKTEN
jgi:hypothetical protein